MLMPYYNNEITADKAYKLAEELDKRAKKEHISDTAAIHAALIEAEQAGHGDIVAILRDMLYVNDVPEDAVIHYVDDPTDTRSAEEILLGRRIGMYATISLDSIRRGNRYATCSLIKPRISHSETVMYRLIVDMPQDAEITTTEGGDTIVKVDLYDYAPYTGHDMAWMEIKWHTEKHQIHLASGGTAGDIMHGAHVVSWMEI